MNNATLPLIEVDNVVKRYDANVVLSNVSLQVGAGEFVALLGPSGCGKTTLLRCIAGFVDPNEGEIRIAGASMKDVPPNKRPVNTVFQNYALFPHMTVTNNIAFGPRRAGVPTAKVNEIVADSLRMVGMTDYAARYPAQLSGGQQQRIALARAIANKPQVLLLDEPLGALDLKLRKQMQLELKHLHQQLGITFIYVTHDQEEALVMADKVVVMNQGRIAQVGTGEQIYNAPNSRYVANFIGEANLLPCTVDASGELQLELGGHKLPYGAPAGVSGGVTLLVRPEHVSLGAPPPGRFVAFKTLLREKVFVGNAVRIYVELPGGQELAISQPPSDQVTGLRVGETVETYWPQDRGFVLAS